MEETSFDDWNEFTLVVYRRLSKSEQYDSRAYINTRTYTCTLRLRAPARVDSMQLLVVIFVCRGSHATSGWVSSGPANTLPVSAVDETIFNYVQS